MNLKEKIILMLESNEKTYEKILSKLNNYDVEGLDNFIDIVSCMNENRYFVDFNNTVEHLINSDDFMYKKDPIYSSNNDFIKMACSQLNNPKFQFIRTPKYLVNLTVVKALLVLIEFNFYFYSDENVKSNQDVVKLIYDSDIICHFTFFVDEFKEGYAIPNYSKNFFDKISKITFDSEKSKELFDVLIREYLSIIMVCENEVSFTFNSHMRVCARYLMACNALKYGRDGVSCEDVVVGYTLALKLLCEDIREYVVKYYNDDKDLKITDFEVDKSSMNVEDGGGLGFKGVVSIIFAIMAFLEVILVITHVIDFFGLEFSNNPIIRFPTLIVSFYVARKFYDYLNEGEDINLFENGKSKIMLLFIIIFIITVIIGIYY